MNKQLNEQILNAVIASGLNDYDQRSALGLARSWIERGTIPEAKPTQVENKRRDDLANELIAILQSSGEDEAEMINALNKARGVVNAPFRRSDFAGRAKLKPKEAAKAEGKA